MSKHVKLSHFTITQEDFQADFFANWIRIGLTVLKRYCFVSTVKRKLKRKLKRFFKRKLEQKFEQLSRHPEPPMVQYVIFPPCYHRRSREMILFLSTKCSLYYTHNYTFLHFCKDPSIQLQWIEDLSHSTKLSEGYCVSPGNLHFSLQ